MAEGLFVASNFLETCKAWQEVVGIEQDREAKKRAAKAACVSLDGKRDYHGATKVIVQSEAAVMMDDGMSTDETIWPWVSFGSLLLRGDLGRAQYVTFGEQVSIAWMLTSSELLDAGKEYELADLDNDNNGELDYYLPDSGIIRRPLYLPVNLIDYALCAN